jgi:hypothetical protein
MVYALMSPLSARAFPFEVTPEGFESYLNGLERWSNGSSYQFKNPRNCYRDDYNTKLFVAVYQCEVDYVEKSALGSRTCIQAKVSYNHMRDKDWEPYFPPTSNEECSQWEKTSTTPQPQESLVDASPARPSIVSNTTSSNPREILLIGVGAGLVLLGGGLGLLLSKLVNRK